MNTVRVCCFGMAIVAFAFLPTSLADDGPSLEGSWSAKKYNGEEPEPSILWTFSAGGKFSLSIKEGDDVKYEAEGTYSVDASETPNRIDLTVTKEDGEEKDDPYKGIFRLEGDKLLLKHGTEPGEGDYPENFDEEEDFDTYELETR
ncbi:MAG: TIGR03067 domain-containing protein [Planctomycetes bacterium]|nr:TIGR03067 domain-containing protein [Planctomycetota bacterium]